MPFVKIFSPVVFVTSVVLMEVLNVVVDQNRTWNPENRRDCRSHCKDKGAEIFSYKVTSDECACKEVDGGILRSESGWVTGPVQGGLPLCGLSCTFCGCE